MVFVVGDRKVEEVSLFQHSKVKELAADLVQLIALLARGHSDEVTLNLGQNSGESCEKWRQHFFISVSGVDGLSSLCHYEKVLPEIVKLSKFIVNFYILLQHRIDLVALEVLLDSLLLS